MNINSSGSAETSPPIHNFQIFYKVPVFAHFAQLKQFNFFFFSLSFFPDALMLFWRWYLYDMQREFAFSLWSWALYETWFALHHFLTTFRKSEQMVHKNHKNAQIWWNVRFWDKYMMDVIGSDLVRLSEVQWLDPPSTLTSLFPPFYYSLLKSYLFSSLQS